MVSDVAIVVGIVGGVAAITLPLVAALLRLEHRLTHIEATITARWPERTTKGEP